MTRRLGLDTLCLVCLTLACISSFTLPSPWSTLAGCAAIATIVAAVASRLLSPTPPKADSFTVAEVGIARRGVEDVIDGYLAAGFDEDEAKDLVRQLIRAEVAKGGAGLRSVRGPGA